MFYQLKIGLLCLAAILTCAGAQRDATLEEGVVGREVTEAVIRKLEVSNIFPDDHRFLLRLAYIETRFGESPQNTSDAYHGGIWAVDETVFKQTQNQFQFPKFVSIERKFNISWPNVEWKDLRKPMYSGIAVALFFSFETGAPIPQKIEDQARHWLQYWRPDRNPSDFIKDAEKLQEETVCRGKFDLCIVLDSSGSIGSKNFSVATSFVGNLTESFSPDFTRVGMVVYSHYTEVIFRLNNTNSTTELADMARNATYHAGLTYTDQGILEAIKLLQEVDDSDGIPKILTVFTDGESNGGPLDGPIELMKNNSIKPLSIGLGNFTNPQELLQIALNDTASVFMIDDYAGLRSFLQQLTSVTCEIPQAPVLNETYDDSLIANEKRIYKIEPPPEGITITINVTEGGAKGYWSYSIPVPTEVLNDGVIEGATYIPAPPGIVGGRQKRQSEGEEEEDDEPLTNIYITIQGVEPTNNYTLVMTDGDNDKEPPTNSTTTTPVTNSTTTAVTNSTTGTPVTNSTTSTPVTNSTTSTPVTNSTTAPVTNSTTLTPSSTPPNENGAPVGRLSTTIFSIVAILHIHF